MISLDKIAGNRKVLPLIHRTLPSSPPHAQHARRGRTFDADPFEPAAHCPDSPSNAGNFCLLKQVLGPGCRSSRSRTHRFLRRVTARFEPRVGTKGKASLPRMLDQGGFHLVRLVEDLCIVGKYISEWDTAQCTISEARHNGLAPPFFSPPFFLSTYLTRFLPLKPLRITNYGLLLHDRAPVASLQVQRIVLRGRAPRAHLVNRSPSSRRPSASPAGPHPRFPLYITTTTHLGPRKTSRRSKAVLALALLPS